MAPADQDVEAQDETAEAPPKLQLEVQVASPSTCERRVTVKIPRDEVERYFAKALDELVPEAAVPGFRAGRAPRNLVQQRYRKDLKDQVRGSLLMDSISQVSEEQKFSAISEPDFDASAVVLPDEGPMTFEFKLEVRPDFDLPEWKGLRIERPVREISESEVSRRLENLLGRYGRLLPAERPAEAGDYITCNLSFRGEAGEISRSREEVLRIRPVLSFRDGRVEGFDKLMKGVCGGETREGTAQLSADAPNPSLRGKAITAVFEVLDVKRLELPKLTPAFLDELGGFRSEEELRGVVRDELARQLEHHQRQHARRQITAALTAGANWELPPDLLRRQSRRELERAVLELRRDGFSDKEIQAHQNELRQNSAASTARALKEHFILERIAEEEKLEVTDEDYDAEVALIAAQSEMSARRVRARLEKRGLMDALHNQIIERKVIDLVLSHAQFTEIPWKPAGAEVEALDQSAGGEDEPEEEIPEATAPDESQPLRAPTDRS
jgi:trigger factor